MKEQREKKGEREKGREREREREREKLKKKQVFQSLLTFCRILSNILQFALTIER